MNERGAVSLVALFVMLIITMNIAGMNNFSVRQADITQNYKTETELQNAAESVFNNVTAEIINDPDLKNNSEYTKLNWKLENDILNTNVTESGEASTFKYVNSDYLNDIIKVSVYLKKYNKKINGSLETNNSKYEHMIVIMAIAEKENYNFNRSVYKKVYGYLTRKVVSTQDDNGIITEDDNESEKHYQFKGYFD